MIFFSILIAVLSFGGMLAVAYAYRSSLTKSDDPATWYFAVSILLIAVSTASRRIYWDILGAYHETYNPDTWQWMISYPNGEIVNMIFNTFVLIAVYYALRARLELIPAHERPGWKWFNAWTYPEGLKGLGDNVRIYCKRSSKDRR